jgi:hypothetical protein
MQTGKRSAKLGLKKETVAMLQVRTRLQTGALTLGKTGDCTAGCDEQPKAITKSENANCAGAQHAPPALRVGR